MFNLNHTGCASNWSKSITKHSSLHHSWFLSCNNDTEWSNCCNGNFLHFWPKQIWMCFKDCQDCLWTITCCPRKNNEQSELNSQHAYFDWSSWDFNFEEEISDCFDAIGPFWKPFEETSLRLQCCSTYCQRKSVLIPYGDSEFQLLWRVPSWGASRLRLYPYC